MLDRGAIPRGTWRSCSSTTAAPTTRLLPERNEIVSLQGVAISRPVRGRPPATYMLASAYYMALQLVALASGLPQRAARALPEVLREGKGPDLSSVVVIRRLLHIEPKTKQLWNSAAPNTVGKEFRTARYNIGYLIRTRCLLLSSSYE
jgi:hypothetical protein